MEVTVDVYTKDLEAALTAYKFGHENGAINLQLNSSHDYDTKEFEYFNLSFEAEHISEAISKLDEAPFARDASDL